MNGLKKEEVVMSKTTLEDASNLVSTQLDMGDAGDGLIGVGETVGGFFDFMKSFSESFDSLGGCSSNCKSGSVVGNQTVHIVDEPDKLWALSISEQLYALNTQVLILTALMVLFIIASLVKPYVLHKISQKKKSIARRK